MRHSILLPVLASPPSTSSSCPAAVLVPGPVVSQASVVPGPSPALLRSPPAHPHHVLPESLLVAGEDETLLVMAGLGSVVVVVSAVTVESGEGGSDGDVG